MATTVVAAFVVAVAGLGWPGAAPRAGAADVGVRVTGNRLVNASGQAVRMLGVDRSGTEYACVQGWGIFDGPSDGASVAAIAAWHVNAVRVPLNEDCWLGINSVDPLYAGAAYRAAITSYVSLLNSYGIVAILDLHWNAPGTELATRQQVMADATHSPAFWTSVASSFVADPGVVFDLYNEPHTISWTCWLHGCMTATGWPAAGMQTLLDAVRATGATQPVMASGLGWSGDLSGWLAHEPLDPDRQLIASFHVYTYSGCNTTTCWQDTVAPVAARVPVVTGELGEDDCGQSFIDRYMAWADSTGVSYLGWAWDAGGGWSCTGGPSLITGYGGTATAMGAGLQAHLAALAQASPATFALNGPGGGGGGSTTPGVVSSGAAGYWEVAADGGMFAFGDAAFYGSMGGRPLAQPIVGIAATPDGKGYWEVAADGGMFAFGDAAFYGSMGGRPLAQSIVGIAATPDGKGYWEVAADGGMFAFGDAAFYGSMGGRPLAQPIVGIAATPDGKGYWEVAADGGMFAFGDAAFYGSMGGRPLAQSIVGIAATPDGKGYWEVAADGGMFAFGDAAFYGSMGGRPLAQPIVGIAATPDGKGYWEVAADGGMFAFGDAAFYGSMGGRPLAQPIVGIAASS